MELDGWRTKHKRKLSPPSAPAREHTFAHRVRRPKFSLKGTSSSKDILTNKEEEAVDKGFTFKEGGLAADNTGLASIEKRAASLPNAKPHDIDVLSDDKASSETSNEKRLSSPSAEGEDDADDTASLVEGGNEENDEFENEEAFQLAPPRCQNTSFVDGEEVPCDGITNGSSQFCHFCKQSSLW